MSIIFSTVSYHNYDSDLFPPNYEYWINMPYWSHFSNGEWLSSEPFMLLLNFNLSQLPKSADHCIDIIRYGYYEHKPDTLLMAEILFPEDELDDYLSFTIKQELDTLYALIDRAIQSGEIVSKLIFEKENIITKEYRVKPLDFFAWTENKGLSIPDQFKELIRVTKNSMSLDPKPYAVEEMIPSEQKTSEPEEKNKPIYENFIRKTKISLCNDDNTHVKISPPGKPPFIRSRSDLGFSDKATAIWPTFEILLKDGAINLGLIPRDKDKYKNGVNDKKYRRIHKQLSRISKSLTTFFSKEWPGIRMPEKYNFFEPMHGALEAGVFKPKFITETEAQGLQVIKKIQRKGISSTALLDALEKETK